VLYKRIMRELFGHKRRMLQETVEKCIMGSSVICIPLQHYQCDQEDDEICRASGTNTGEKCVLVMIPETKRPLGKCRHRLECNIKMGLDKFGLDACGSGWDKWQTPVNIVNETLDSTKCTNISIVCLSPNIFHYE
jgi:hypothetical protein